MMLRIPRGFAFGFILLIAILPHTASWVIHGRGPSSRYAAGRWVGTAPVPRNYRWPARSTATLTQNVESEHASKFMLPARRRFGAGAFALVRVFFFLVWFLVLGSIFVPGIALANLAARNLDAHRRTRVDTLIQRWTFLLVRPFFRVQVIGEENLPPPDQACVYVANHSSFMDILSSFYLRRSFKFISNASIFKIPLVGYAMKSSGHVGLERDDPASQISVFKKCIRMLKANTPIFIFPEATRSKTGRLLKFRAMGPFKMAKRVGVPIVPITIRGTGRIMPSGKEYMVYSSGAGVQVIVHPPISAEDAKAMDDENLVARTKAQIASALPPEYRGDV